MYVCNACASVRARLSAHTRLSVRTEKCVVCECVCRVYVRARVRACMHATSSCHCASGGLVPVSVQVSVT